MPLGTPLTALPTQLFGSVGTDLTIDPEELRVAGVTNWLYRSYLGDHAPGFSLYVGYYPNQQQGKSIHSPKNCLPGAGWDAVNAIRLELAGAGGSEPPVRVNRFVVANKEQRAVVYYWYQGRGRTESNEYRVKLDLMVDAATRRRTEEALVRIVLPLSNNVAESEADDLGRRLVTEIAARLGRVLPT
jgi:EpsI family protein